MVPVPSGGGAPVFSVVSVVAPVLVGGAVGTGSCGWCFLPLLALGGVVVLGSGTVSLGGGGLGSRPRRRKGCLFHPRADELRVLRAVVEDEDQLALLRHGEHPMKGERGVSRELSALVRPRKRGGLA